MNQRDASFAQKTTLSQSNLSTLPVSLCAWITLLLGSSLPPILWVAWLGYKQEPVWSVAELAWICVGSAGICQWHTGQRYRDRAPTSCRLAAFPVSPGASPG